MIKELFSKKNEEPLKSAVALSGVKGDTDAKNNNDMSEKKEEEAGEETTAVPAATPKAEKVEPEDEGEKGKTKETEKREAVEAAYCLGAGIDSDTLARAKAILDEIAECLANPAFSPTALHYAVRLLNYEKSVEEARARGYEAGKAESLAAAFRNRRLQAEHAASIPHYNGSRNVGTAREENIFDVARGVK